jgi:hypothetical protein
MGEISLKTEKILTYLKAILDGSNVIQSLVTGLDHSHGRGLRAVGLDLDLDHVLQRVRLPVAREPDVCVFEELPIPQQLLRQHLALTS